MPKHGLEFQSMTIVYLKKFLTAKTCKIEFVQKTRFLNNSYWRQRTPWFSFDPQTFSSSILSQRLSFFLETVRNFSWGRDDDRLGEFSWKVPKGVGWSSNDLVWKDCLKDGFLDRTRRQKVPPTRFLWMLTDATWKFWWQLKDSSSNAADRKFYSF